MFAPKYLFVAFALFASLVSAAPIAEYFDEGELAAREPLPSLKHLAQAVGVARKLRTAIKPKPNGAVFWSGTKTTKKGKEVSVKADATKFAKKHGKETLNMALKKHGVKIPTEKQNPHSPRLWNIASKLMAQRAKGETHAVLGSKVRPGSVWKKIEKPTLMKNKKVTKVTEHNAATKKKTVTKGKK
ncbi:hypothetical protein NLJ89_g2959 [Agrocybe chaxingu]|uniref:Uncharacterized protein n=1 Tax=Agrocybe chaxingu TaxID=84603 RepID=A0A9W8K5L4_9AGAR|nr:hypothetical protein NLJ89_g2959 [Agrocybe chaxingu]